MSLGDSKDTGQFACKSIAYQGYSFPSDSCATKYTGRSVSLKVPAFNSLP